MRKTLFLFICAAAGAFWSCNKNSNPVNSTNGIPSISGSYFPLAVGDQWTVHIWYDSAGIKKPGSDATGPEEIIKDTTIGGRAAYGVGVPGSDTAIVYYALDAQGNQLQFLDTSLGKGLGEWNLATEFTNTVKGRAVTFYSEIVTGYSFGGGPINLVRISDTTVETFMGDTTITVPAGTFNAEYYKDSSFSNTPDTLLPGSYAYTRSDKFYVRGIGLIKEDELNVNAFPPYISSFGIHEELVSYSLK